MNEWVWGHMHETFVFSTVPSQNMHDWDPIRELPPFHVLGMTVKSEYVRRENMKSGICKDVDNNAVPPVPTVTLN